MNWIGKSIAWFGFAFSWLLVHLPNRLREAFGACIGVMWFDVFRIRRQVVLSNLTLAFPEMSRAEKVRMGRRAMINFGKNVVDYSFMPFLEKMPVESMFETEGLDVLKRAQERGAGVMLITCHLGHGDMACAGLSKMGFPIYMVSKFFSFKLLNDLWFGMRERVGTKFIPPRNSSYALLKALKNKGVVVVPLDQFTGPPIGVATRFFGHDTGTAAGPALMAERAKSPVVMAYTYRLENGRHRLCFQDEIDVHLGEDHDRGIAEYTQRFNDIIESFVRKHPDQWMWIHKRWKTFELH
jgi:KDO2-lipid IV(A) lauroyltransferase